MPFDEKITINLQKLVDICLHELPTNLQNSMQNDLKEVKIFRKVFFGGGATFFVKTPCILFRDI